MTKYDPPLPSIAKRATAIKKAMDEVQKQRAKRLVQDALQTRNGPNTTDIHNLKLNSEVLVQRDAKAGQKGHWDGPFRLISQEGEDCVIQQGNDRATFRSTKLKPFFTRNTDITSNNTNGEDSADKNNGSTNTELPDKSTKMRKLVGVVIPARKADISVFLQDLTNEAYTFETSRSAEVAGLIKNGTFKVANRTSILEDVRIFKSRFVDKMKNRGGTTFEKSHLVV